MVKDVYFLSLFLNSINMTKRIFYIILLMSLVLQTKLFAQFVPLQDSAVAAYLCKNYPTTLDATCKNIDTVKSKTVVTKRLVINQIGVKTLADLKYLSGINFIKADSNSFTTVDMTFDNFPLVFGLNFTHNNLTAFPDVSPLKPNLKELYLGGNNIEELIGLDSTKSIQNLNLDGNHLRKIPVITTSPNLIVVRLMNNYFTYEDLLTVADYPNFKSIFYIYPQKNLTGNKSKVVFENDTLVLSTDIDTNVANVTYTWYKNNVSVKSSAEPFLKIPNFKATDAGDYYVELKHNHPNLASGSLRTGKWTVTSATCQTVLNTKFDMNSTCASSILNIESIELSNTNWPFSYFVENTYTKERKEVFIGKQNEIKQMGDFNLVVTDNLNCEVKLDNWVSIHPTNCDIVFTPDGDGNNDTFLIEGKGKVKILNKRGQVVNQIQLPIYWDGKDHAGKNLPVGLYGIQFEDGHIEKVTLLR